MALLLVGGSCNLRVILLLRVCFCDGHESTSLALRFLQRDALSEVFQAVLLVSIDDTLLLLLTLGRPEHAGDALTACFNDGVGLDRLELVEQLEGEQLAEVAEWQVDHLLGVRDGGSHGAADLDGRVLDVGYIYLSLVIVTASARSPPVDRSLIRHKLLLIHILSLSTAPTEERWSDFVSLVPEISFKFNKLPIRIRF